MNKPELKIFENPNFGEVRIIMSENNEPIFCLSDVCKSLDLSSKEVNRRLSDEVVSKHPIIDRLGREQQALFVNEDGLYDVILESRKSESKLFRKWVTSEVLPSIRKNGAYMTESTIERALTDPDFLIQLATNLKEEKRLRMEAESKNLVLEEKIKEDEPRVLFSVAVEESKDSIQIKELSDYLTQNGINIGRNKLMVWMRRNGYLCFSTGLWNQPTKRSMDLGLFEIKKTRYIVNDEIKFGSTTMVTGKGQKYFVNKFLGI